MSAAQSEAKEIDAFATRTREWTPVDSILLATITLAGFLLRVLRLGDPSKLIFDEVYYAKDACFYLHSSRSICDATAEVTTVHPPLGKWLLALGIRLFGYDSFGWRIAAVVAGAITISLVYLLARKLLRSTLGASMASGLVAIDLLLFVQSRTAMVDIFVPMFGLAAILFVVYDRDRILDATNGADRGRGPLERPWRLAAGLAGGAATASKWSGIFFLLTVLLLTIGWEVASRRDQGLGRAWSRTLAEEGASIVVWLLVAPLAVYMFTFLGRLEGDLLALPWSEGSWWRAWWERQFSMLDFHQDLAAQHTYQSPGWSWLLLKRPVSSFFETAEHGDYKEIFATGSPLVWWSSVIALIAASVTWIRRRALGRPEGVIMFGFAMTYLPWLVIAYNRPATFLFYMTPVVPFMCIAIAYAALRLGESKEARAAQTVFALGATVLFAFYYPLIADVAIPQPSWQRRIWIFDHCEKPVGTPVEATVTTTVDGVEKTEVTTSNDNSSLPPIGWCWI